MTITYPLMVPAGPGFGSVTIRKNSVVGVNRSPYTGSQQAIAYPGQWWEADISLPTLNNARSAAWEAWLGKLNGREGTFLLSDPVRRLPRGSAHANYAGLITDDNGQPLLDDAGDYLLDDSGAIAVHGAHAARSQTLTIRNAPASTTGWLLAGDYIQLGTGLTTRLHQLLDDANTDATGHATLTIWPKTRTAIGDGDTVRLTDCKGLFRMTSNIQAIDRRRGPFASLSFSCIEAI